ncbi:metalloregulator ArsR/SmtB family transcription factor [Maricaulis sp.]|uniref:ArsR/SmtB family transcription factor n=1 Tax=Maricaulis sp. TaxID=1486257 RepID=UPI002607A612|nr:metalloregulator ArsR/SmtB family transcription factor [Maricaulis sp.]
MDDRIAAGRFAALAHPTRLSVFRRLMQAGPDGLAAGVLAEALDVAPNNLSAHLNTMSQAGLIEARREGRSRIYVVRMETTAATVGFLIEDCCQGHPDICDVVTRQPEPVGI